MPNTPHPTPMDLTRAAGGVVTRPCGRGGAAVRGESTCTDGEKSIRRVAGEAGLDEGSVRRVLSGTAWPHLRAMVLLEESLGVRLRSR